MELYGRVLYQGQELYIAVTGDSGVVLSGSFLDGSSCPTSNVVPLADCRWLAPLPPRTILAVGRNYRAHAEELGNALPSAPLLFLKQPGTVVGHEAAILIPSDMGRIDFEGELVIVMGRMVSWATPREAIKGSIYGYTIGNDVTARELQKADGQWTRAKGFDTFGPVGPVVARKWDWKSSGITTTVDGVVKQQAPFSDMIFDPEFIVYYASRFMTLEPGDFIFSGTPAGVGPLEPDNIVEISINGIGKLRNTVKRRE